MPTEEWAAQLLPDDENNRSLLLRFSFGETSFLYTGDLETDGEAYFLSECGENITSDVLKVGHHGSSTSTSLEFLRRIDPEYAYIPVGKNSYGHPDEEVLRRLREEDIRIFRADEDKDVVFTLDRKRILHISE